MAKGTEKGADFLGLLLSRLGLGKGQAAEPKRRKRKRRQEASFGPDGAVDAPFPAPSESGAFAAAVGAAALGQEAHHELASFAPPPRPVVNAAEGVEDGELRLPNFGVEAPPGDRPTPVLKKPEAPPKPAEGKIFDMNALEDNLDELFSGLSAGVVPQSAPGAFDEFGLGRAVPVPSKAAHVPPVPGMGDPNAGLASLGPVGLDDPFEGPDPFKPEPPLVPAAPKLDAPPAPPTLGPVAAVGIPPKPLMPEGTGHVVDPDAPYRPPSPPPESLTQAESLPQAALAPSPAVAKAAGSSLANGGMAPAPLSMGGAAAVLLPLSGPGQLKRALDALAHVSGVAGALVVGTDGLAIASSLPPSFDAEALGAQLGSLFHDLSLRLKSQGRQGLRRVLLESESGVLVVCAADMGILVVVSHEGQGLDASAVWAALTGALGIG